MTRKRLPNHEYAFADFRFNPVRKEIRNGPEARKLTPGQSDLLLHFVTHPRRIWDSDSFKRKNGAFRVAVAALRKKLGELKSDGAELIQTVEGGYVFAEDIAVIPLADGAGPPDAMWLNWFSNQVRELNSDHKYEKVVSLLEKALRRFSDAALPARVCDLLIETVIAQMALYGYASPRIKKMLDRILNLLKRLGEGRVEISLFFWLLHLVRGEFKDALSFAERALDFAKKQDHDWLLSVAAWTGMGVTQTHLGKLEEALNSLTNGQEAMACDPSIGQQARYPSLYIVEPGVACLCQTGLVEWLLGRPDSGLSTAQKARDRAKLLKDAGAESHALLYLAWIHQLRGEVDETKAIAEEAITHGRLQVRLWANMLAGWAAAHESGKISDGIRRMRDGVARQERYESLIARSYFLTLLADTLDRRGGSAALGDARRQLTMADIVSINSGEQFFASEIARLHGRVLKHQDGDNLETVAEHFRKSVSIARSLGAKSLELRALTELACYVEEYPHSVEEMRDVRDDLIDLEGSFEEGKGTADLIRAAEVIEMLDCKVAPPV
jgi:DNA-binding winged helix-turn-helix (wHTH) protein